MRLPEHGQNPGTGTAGQKEGGSAGQWRKPAGRNGRRKSKLEDGIEQRRAAKRVAVNRIFLSRKIKCVQPWRNSCLITSAAQVQESCQHFLTRVSPTVSVSRVNPSYALPSVKRFARHETDSIVVHAGNKPSSVSQGTHNWNDPSHKQNSLPK